MHLRLLAIFAAASALARPAWPQTSQPRRQTVTPFDTSLWRVPTTTRRTDLPTLYGAVGRPTRGEYETTAEWEARIESHRRAVLGRFFAVWYNPPACSREPVWSYDVDAETIELNVSLEINNGLWSGSDSSSRPAFVTTLCGPPATTIERGSTALGVRRTYPLEGRRFFGVVLPGDYHSYRDSSNEERFALPVWVRLPMARDSVRRLRPFIRYLLVFRVRDGSPSDRLNVKGLDMHSPTLREAWATYHEYFGVKVDYVELWLIDSRQSSVIAKLPLPPPTSIGY
jgi:hypothetical protein